MKRLIPPQLFLLCVVLMVILNLVTASTRLVPFPYNYLGFILLIGGLYMAVHVRRQFAERETEIHTFKKPKQLVTHGLFRLSRNPIYLGFAISLLGLGIVLGYVWPFAGWLLFMGIAHFWYIPFEEKMMAGAFGTDYHKYRSKVRRWI